MKFDEMNKKNFIQNTFYYHPFFSTSTYSPMNGYQVNNIQSQQQPIQEHDTQFQALQFQQSHPTEPQTTSQMLGNQETNEQPQYDENANLRLLMDVAVGLWEEQQRNFEFRN